MKRAAILVAIVIFIACLALLGSRVRVVREEADELMPKARLEATPLIEGRPGPQRDVTDTTTRVEAVAPAPALRGSPSHTQSDTDDINGAVPQSGLLDAISPSDAMSPVVDTTVIGRRFPVSAATAPKCMEGEEESLPREDKRRIEQFTGEPRDPAWANGAERLLRSMAEERNPGFRIRNLECRLTTCIIEVESTDRILGPELALKTQDWRAGKIKPFGVRTGEESSPPGQNLVLTLWIYQRIR